MEDFFSNNKGPDHFYGIEIIDDKGNAELKRFYNYTGSSTTEDKHYIYGGGKAIFDSLPDGKKTFTIRPYVDDSSNWKWNPDYIYKKLDHLPSESNPIVLSEGNAGEIFVTGIQFLKDRTIVSYRAAGTDPYFGRGLFLTNKSGEKILFSNIDQPQTRSTIKENMLEYPPMSPDNLSGFTTVSLQPIHYYPEMESSFEITR